MTQTQRNQALVAAIIVAGGRGSRAASDPASLPKQYRMIGDLPVIARTLGTFYGHPRVGRVLTVIHRNDAETFANAVQSLAGPHLTATGGATRQASVLAGLEALAGDLEISDACTIDAALVVTSSQTSVGTCPIVITRTYKVTDACMNTSVDILHYIYINDTTPPVV